jgi:type IV secretory pathway TrbD component
MPSNGDVPTVYTDPLIIRQSNDTEIYRQDDDVPRPRPASPAASIQPETAKTDFSAYLPKPGSAWQRTYPTALTTRAGNALAPSLANRPAFVPSPRGSASQYAVGNIVYQSLQRPKLLRGGEWQLSVTNNLVAAGFAVLTLITWNWHFILGAAFFGWPVQWLIRVLGRHDPKFWRKYLRSVRQPLIREPHGSPNESAPALRILPKQSFFIH